MLTLFQFLCLVSLLVAIVTAYDGPLYPQDMGMPMPPEKHADFDMKKWDHDANGQVDHAEIAEEIRKVRFYHPNQAHRNPSINHLQPPALQMYYNKRKKDSKKLKRTVATIIHEPISSILQVDAHLFMFCCSSRRRRMNTSVTSTATRMASSPVTNLSSFTRTIKLNLIMSQTSTLTRIHCTITPTMIHIKQSQAAADLRLIMGF